MRQVCFVLALLAAGLATSTPAGAEPPGGRPARLPGDARWDYGAWADDYLVVATDYDADTRRVTWTLETRRKVTGRTYQARFTDPDLLDLDTRDLQFVPAQKEYKKGSRIKATLKLPAKDVLQEANRVTIGPAP
jgi:hypothetical protein